jgi:hypothetical protein
MKYNNDIIIITNISTIIEKIMIIQYVVRPDGVFLGSITGGTLAVISDVLLFIDVGVIVELVIRGVVIPWVGYDGVTSPR